MTEEDDHRKEDEEESGETEGLKAADVDVEIEVEGEVEKPIPPDGGYGWFVLAGMFISLVLMGGIMKSSGLVFLQLQERFQIGALQAAWPVSIMATVAQLVAPLAAAICNRYSERTCVMLGSASFVAGLLLTGFVNDFYFLFFSLSILQGAGLGFVTTPGVIIIASYFDKRRGFVTSLGSTGGSVGTFSLVPLVNILFDYYGFEGTFLILAALGSHGFLVALLFRPFYLHQKFSNPSKSKIVTTYRMNGNGNGNADHSLVPLKQLPQKPAPDERVKSCPGIRSYFKICFPSEHSRKGNSKNKKIFHFNLLTDVSFVLHLISVVFLTMAMRATYLFIPAICIDKGLTKSDAALVLTISGAVDTFGRIGCGYILDFPKLRPLRPLFYTGFLFGIGVAAFFIPFLNSFVSLAIVCTAMGVCFGAYISQRAVVIVDLMGKELMASCIGLIKLFQAFGILCGPIIYGGIRDATDSYDFAFFSGFAALMISGVLMMLSMVVRHCTLKQSGGLLEVKNREEKHMVE